MRAEVVDGTVLNSKWIPTALNGFFDVMVSCSRLTAWGNVVVDSCLASCRRNWLLQSFARQDSSGVAEKNRCLALGLLEIPVRPAWTFMSLLSCSHAWSAPTDMKGMVLFVTEMLPSSSSLHVHGQQIQIFLTMALNNKLTTDVIYIDFQTVSHTKLLA